MDDSKRTGVKTKRVDAVKLKLSMKTAMSDLKLDKSVVIYPGKRAIQFGRKY